jgi:two-component sensor histidine kinase/HAMP domain-containing protein
LPFHPFKNLSIKRKLTVINQLTTAIALLVAVTAFIVYESLTFRSTLLRELAINAEIIANNSTAALTFDERKTAEEILSALRAEKHVISACIYTKNDQIFATYIRKDAKPEFPRTVPAEGQKFMNNTLILTRPIFLENDLIGKVYLKYDLMEMRSRFSRYAVIVLGVILISSLISLAVAKRLQRMISKPILHLADTAYTVSLKNDYTIRARKETEDEVGQLTDGFNEMLSQMQDRDQELIKAQENLEKRVQERTKELKQEIFERIRVEHRLRESLKEKEVLLKEIHHRVKNNLQVISSLLYLQSKKIKHQPAMEMFVESQNRIRSMALIHEKLYQSTDMVHIDFSEYIHSLIGHLSSSYGAKLVDVKINILIEDVHLSIDKGIPCALIVNELVVNALKYAFPKERKGEITIRISRDGDGSVVLSVADNGVGIPHTVDLANSETLGLQLVKHLSQQLKGRIDIRNGQGTNFLITFQV